MSGRIGKKHIKAIRDAVENSCYFKDCSRQAIALEVASALEDLLEGNSFRFEQFLRSIRNQSN